MFTITITYRKERRAGKKKKEKQAILLHLILTAVGFEPTPFTTGA
jgi:hypothetical protein